MIVLQKVELFLPVSRWEDLRASSSMGKPLDNVHVHVRSEREIGHCMVPTDSVKLSHM